MAIVQDGPLSTKPYCLGWLSNWRKTFSLGRRTHFFGASLHSCRFLDNRSLAWWPLFNFLSYASTCSKKQLPKSESITDRFIHHLFGCWNDCRRIAILPSRRCECVAWQSEVEQKVCRGRLLGVLDWCSFSSVI